MTESISGKVCLDIFSTEKISESIYLYIYIYILVHESSGVTRVSDYFHSSSVTNGSSSSARVKPTGLSERCKSCSDVCARGQCS